MTGRLRRNPQVLLLDAAYWTSLREFGRAKRILVAEDEKALIPACKLPSLMPTDRQATRLIELVGRAKELGWTEQ